MAVLRPPYNRCTTLRSPSAAARNSMQMQTNQANGYGVGSETHRRTGMMRVALVT